MTVPVCKPIGMIGGGQVSPHMEEESSSRRIADAARELRHMSRSPDMRKEFLKSLERDVAGFYPRRTLQRWRRTLPGADGRGRGPDPCLPWSAGRDGCATRGRGSPTAAKANRRAPA